LAAGVVALVASACVPPAPPPPPLAPPPPDIGLPANSPNLNTNQTFVTQTSGPVNLDHPWDIAFTPSAMPTGIFTERLGRISSFDPVAGGPAKLLGSLPETQQSGESGLMGLAIDPSFDSNGFVYVCVSAGTNQIRRLTVNLAAAPGAGITADVLLLSGMQQSSFHDGCRVRFEPGTRLLYWSMGDAGVGPAPQDLSKFGGKILRANVDMSGNITPAGIFGGYVYTYGHRNPQGIAFQQGGAIFDTEHGPTINDEVNKLVPGGNAGWDPNTNGSYDQSHPMTDLVKFPGAIRPSWRSGDSFTLAPSGATFIATTPTANWMSWSGALVVAFLKDSKVRVMFVDANGNVAASYPTLALGSRLRSVVQGPDGSLYISTDNGNDAIWKVTPS
jgi:glucose/arabinose dehydrogenase